MAEIEEIVGIEGLPLLEKSDEDNCCEHAPIEGFECEWSITRVILPEIGVDDAEESEDSSAQDRSQRQLTEAYDEINAQGGTPTEVIAGQSGNLALLALQLGFPILKPFFEEQVRRATVSVKWKEGPSERGFDVIQYLVSEQIASEDPTATEETQ